MGIKYRINPQPAAGEKSLTHTIAACTIQSDLAQLMGTNIQSVTALPKVLNILIQWGFDLNRLLRTKVTRKMNKMPAELPILSQGTPNQANIIPSCADIGNVFLLGRNSYDSYGFFLSLKQIKGLALCVKFYISRKKKETFLYYLKTTKISFSFPACKLVHCACVSIDCLVISFYDNLQSFVVRDLASSFNLIYCITRRKVW